MTSPPREADAIIIAKTKLAEWAFSPKQMFSSSYGTTANAYDLARVPAGFSGGTASDIAASFGVIGMGSDTQEGVLNGVSVTPLNPMHMSQEFTHLDKMYSIKKIR